MEEFYNESNDGYISMGACLIKADQKLKDVIYIEASNELEDSQGDTILKKALETQKSDFLNKGVLSWDHQHKLQQDPNFICGEPLDVKFSKHSTLVKGKIYTKNKYGVGILAMAQSNSSRLGASVGGHITKRVQKVDDLTKSIKKYITGVLWDEVALTYKPVNESVLGNVSILPFEEFAKSFVCRGSELYKALSAGDGIDSSTMVGGRSLIAENLKTGKSSVATLGHRLDVVLKAIHDGKVDNYHEFDSLLIKNDLVPHRKQLMKLVIKNNITRSA